ncbi:MAG TPA: hypothetical protein VES97_11320 [Solirubrobacteraceae bacterium]|nr:hypothetical protein [Solirubrobacteraceae bacterium]
MPADLLTTIRGEIDARLRELRPLVAEYERLLAGGEALGIGAGASKGPSPRPTRPTAATGRRRARGARGSAAGAIGRAASPAAAASGAGEVGARRKRAGDAGAKRERAPRGEAQQAIVAALEHGSHTVGELAVVTAMPGAIIRDNLRRLLKAGTLKRARREGKAAYALAGGAGR